MPPGILAHMRRGGVLAAALAAAGCGSLPAYRTPKAAEPARSPALAEPPAGRVVQVGAGPEGVAADPRSGRVAVALHEPPTLALLRASDGAVVRRVPLPGAARHLQLARPGGPFLVPAETANQVVEVMPDGTARPPRPTGAQPHDATAAGGRIFAGDERADTVTVLGEERFRVARQPGGLAPVEDGRQVAVVSVRDRVIELYDARSLRRTARANAGVGPTHVVSDGRETLYVTDTAGDALLVFRTRPRLELTRRVALRTAPYGIALDTRRRRLWVTLTGTNRIVKLWTNGPRTVANLASVRQPDTVAVDETTGRAFVTGRADGVLQLLDPADRRPRTR
ncbi:MAG TPA: hypothetical protein VF533_12700 [Solirubrobacteraceae bacterium]|jgi:DNA-binding beta-propeller fold protein YncE